MSIQDIVSEIDAEISRLHQVRSLLTATHTIVKPKLGRPAGVKSLAKASPKRVLSAEARAKIAAAQKLRWAKFKKSVKKTAAKSSPVAKKAPSKATKVKKAATSSTASVS